MIETARQPGEREKNQVYLSITSEGFIAVGTTLKLNCKSAKVPENIKKKHNFMLV